ncbi:hypothetical protein FB446DRAFT_632503, partial [Lentinula raphanica]
MTDVTPTLLAALIMYIKNRSSTRTMRVNLALLRCILRGFAKRHGIHTKVPSIIPKDIHTIVDHYDLNPTLHVSILCPRCYALYPFTDEELTKAEDAHKNNTPLPLCIEKSSPDSLSCGTTLWRTVRNGKQSFLAPIRKQVFQDLKAWIGRFLAIPGIEDTISKHQQRDPPPEAGPERDFVDSAVFRNFKGVDGQPFALPQIGPSGNPDLRLVMSLGFDGFNPFYQKETHAQEYMYLATVIPGKPKQHQINHTLRVIVNQLLPFWKGISYSRTARYHTGRTVFIALLPTVCDTEAAIQISGFAAHNHTYFCRRCLLSINNIHNLDSETWIMRDPDRHKQIAFEWKDAPQARREALYRDNGVRWTELLNLPYWNPILYTVIDDMHLGYLGLFKTHLRIIWGIDHEKSGGDGLASSVADPDMIPPVTKPAAAILFNRDQEFEELKSQLLDLGARAPSLSKHKKSVLQALCQDLSIPYNAKDIRRVLTGRLLLHRQEHRDSSLKQGSPRAVIGKDLLEEIWADMALSVLPSWIQPAPQKWGIPAAGKLSADEYKVVCSISLVITLIRVWGYENKEGPESRRYQMLLNFLDLVHSLHVIFLRETSQSSRVYYKATILKYLHGVLELFPDVVLSSNHHLALHVIDDLENLGPGHARSTPVFERINHSLQETKKNGHLGDIEATMLTSYGRMANLQILLDHFPELQEEIQEALTVLKDIEREDHRGM